jgi:hypothetical protein
MIQKNDIISTLNDWNYWNRNFSNTQKRQFYEDRILEKEKTGEIVILKGVRRCGKSTLLLNTIKNLINSGVEKNNILFVNLEDPKFMNYLDIDLLTKIKDVYLEYLNPQDIPCIFLDEIQNIDGFEKWLLKEYELKQSRLFVTGSNAKLLSKEIGTALSGRFLDEFILPLSFKEYLKFKGLNIANSMDMISHSIEINRYFEEFIQYGGFPKIVLTDNTEMKKEMLRSYFDSILMRDVVSRYALDNVVSLMKLSVYALSNISQSMSINSIKNQFQLSFDLVRNYIEYIENAYLIFRVSIFDWSLKKQNVNPQKIYCIDQGLSNIVSFNISQRIGDRLENIVFLELLRHGFEIYYYKKAGDYEVDFIVKKNQNIVKMIQVSNNIDNAKTKKREIKALVKASTDIPHAQKAELLLLVPDRDETTQMNGKEIVIKNVKAWLLNL